MVSDTGEPDEPVRVIVLNDRPESANSLTFGVMAELQAAVESAGDRAILLLAKGKSFCSGLDRFDVLKAIVTEESCERPLERLLALYSTILRYEPLTVCVVQGEAVGGGVGLAACFDCVFALPEAVMTIPFGAYVPLARVLIPVLNLRRVRFGFQDTDDWIGKSLPAGEAQGRQLVNEIIHRDELNDADAPRELTRRARRNARPIDPVALARCESGFEQAKEAALKAEVGFAIGVGLIHNILGSLIHGLNPDRGK